MSKTRKKLIGALALLFGILVLLKPDLLAILVGIYFVVIGVSHLVE